MTARKVPGGISVIEQIVAVYHDFYAPILSWDQLSPADRIRLMDAMEAAVGIIPDRLVLKHGAGTATADTGGGRDALLADHRHAKTSALYGL